MTISQPLLAYLYLSSPNTQRLRRGRVLPGLLHSHYAQYRSHHLLNGALEARLTGLGPLSAALSRPSLGIVHPYPCVNEPRKNLVEELCLWGACAPLRVW
jgi:hypothetical protein